MPQLASDATHSRLQRILWSVYAAHPLMIASERVTPGMLLETKWRPSLDIDSKPRFIREEGFAWEVLGLTDLKPYTTHMLETSVLVGSVADRVTIGGSVPLAQYGLSIAGVLERERTAKLTIGAVRVRTFETGFAGHDLRRRLRELKTANRIKWRWVDDDYLVTKAFHASELRFEFQESGAVSGGARAALSGANLSFSSTVRGRWENDHVLTLTGAASAPFAVRGMKV